jgi:5-(carboxyamino)imidazole ribonucleotide mutase
MKAVLILGSTKDEQHAEAVCKHLRDFNIPFEQHVTSAHKEPHRLLELLDIYTSEVAVVFITIAGRSNALSGFVAANSKFPTIACPPFVDKLDMLVNIQSTLQMPSKVPVMTVLDPGNAALAVKRILDMVK